ncbi:glucose PTS transporter subunit IIA [Frigoribacterium faeni]|uniref:glucose PTS transporter subunit IIA n=1 Tax=Frigoribacterium faeni TaxID=145483 RepID=UPI00141AA240|nr:glucose-specific phosphotransferase system IIA component [Frigoribacterium faeni]
MTVALAPVTGRVVSLADVPDAVFAGQLVGAGVAIEPSAPPAGGRLVDVVSPVDGEVVKLHPHAFAVVHESGTGLLVHVGIDTVKLGGEGFELAIAEGAAVAAGDVVVRFDPTVVAAAGYSAVCPVVVLDSAPDSVPQQSVGSDVEVRSALFEF